MKKVKYITIMLIAIIFITAMCSGVCEAYDWDIDRFDTAKSNIDGKATSVVGSIISVTRIIAVGVAIIMLLV